MVGLVIFIPPLSDFFCWSLLFGISPPPPSRLPSGGGRGREMVMPAWLVKQQQEQGLNGSAGEKDRHSDGRKRSRDRHGGAYSDDEDDEDRKSK